MILTVTMNPSMDISYRLTRFATDSVNRVSEVRKEAGGKGLNVSRVIKLAEEEVLATGVIGGILGTDIISHLNQRNIANDFYPIAGESRNCIAILHQGFQTEILEPGPVITSQEQDGFLQHFSSLIEQSSVITMSGSLPAGVGKDFYRQLICLANRKQKKVLLDCSGENLESVVAGNDLPWLIKPNKQEIEQLTGGVLDTTSVSSFIDRVNRHPGLQKIPWIIVSLGKLGAFARIDDGYYIASIPEINTINAVGSGDATLAGLAIAASKGESAEIALKRAMTFGILNAAEAQTGCINMASFESVFHQVKIHSCF